MSLLTRAPVRRRTLTVGAAGAAGAAVTAGMVAAGCHRGSSSPSPGPSGTAQVTYLTSFGITAREAYVLIAREQGFFTEQGLEVTVEAGTGGDGNHQALAGGAAQFAAVDSTGALIRYGNDPADGEADRYRLLAMVHQQPLLAWLALADSGIAHPHDLEGRRLGLAAGSVAELIWPVYANLADIDTDQVETVPTSPQSQVQELAAGQVDAIAQFVASRPSLENATGTRIEALPWSEYLPDLYGNTIITTRELADQQPDLVDRFTTALLAGLEYTIDHPDETGDILHQAEPALDPETTAAEVELMAPYVRPQDTTDPVGTLAPERLARAVTLLQAADAVPAASRLADGDQRIVAWPHVPGADAP